MKKVLVAGSTGYLGKYVVKAFKEKGYWVRVLTRDEKRLAKPGPFTAPAVDQYVDDVFVGKITKPETLAGLMDDIDIVFSSIGKSRQKDLLTFEEVDYQCNKNLLDLAVKSNIEKYIYISLYNPYDIMHLEIVRCHEMVVNAIKEAGINHTIIRPSGYFSDMGVLLDMAKKGKSWVIGEGHNKFNPIHGADLAKVCAEAAAQENDEIEVGGPDILTQREAAALAFEVLGKEPNIKVFPMKWATRAVKLIRVLNKQFGDLADFIVTAGEVDGVAPQLGTTTLRSYFEELSSMSCANS
jgi:uncharacterized protein YbjT (DUF2867 family)